MQARQNISHVSFPVSFVYFLLNEFLLLKLVTLD